MEYSLYSALVTLIQWKWDTYFCTWLQGYGQIVNSELGYIQR